MQRRTAIATEACPSRRPALYAAAERSSTINQATLMPNWNVSAASIDRVLCALGRESRRASGGDGQVLDIESALLFRHVKAHRKENFSAFGQVKDRVQLTFAKEP
jgi:hypothetical protein